VIRSFTLDYWLDDGWYVGKLREVPGVFSQGESLEALKTNISDAYGLVMQEAVSVPVERFDSTELD
jgi:predicted RNase H-like HicB family nuclease